jgi:hypothetical protein
MLETPARIEPLYFDDAVPTVLADLAIEPQKAFGLAAALRT